MAPVIAEPSQLAFRTAVLDAGLLIDSGVPGVYGRSAAFERLRLGVDALIDDVAAADGAEQLRFPAVMPRHHLETSGYVGSFPHLSATVFAFDGDEPAAARQAERAGRHEDWDADQRMTDLVLVPAACYPVYPALAAREPLTADGVLVDAGGAWVFRREPSHDPARMQTFHQRELVRVGDPDVVVAWRTTWLQRCLALLGDLGLDAHSDVASDPFFGRQGRILGSGQRQQALKFEVSVPIAGQAPTAVASFNYHRDHFATRFGLRRGDGGTVHTACLGFGLERIALALLHEHGLEPAAWDPDLRRRLRLP